MTTSVGIALRSGAALARRGGVNRECVDAAREFRGERRIDHAMAFEPALSLERLRHDIDPEMGLPARPVSGMAFVSVGFVLHLQALRREGVGQLTRDNIGGSHALAGMQDAAAGQCRICGAIEFAGLSSLEGVTPAGA